MNSINIRNYHSNDITKLNQYPPTFKGESNKPEQTSLRDEFAKEGIELPKLTPLQTGLAIGGISFLGFLAFDRLLGKAIKAFQYPMKYALVVNGIIGAVNGIQAYLKEKKNSAK